MHSRLQGGHQMYMYREDIIRSFVDLLDNRKKLRNSEVHIFKFLTYYNDSQPGKACILKLLSRLDTLLQCIRPYLALLLLQDI